MSALAAGCRSGGRAGYSNAAVAYFVALAFGWAALEERVSQTIIPVSAESQSENLSVGGYSTVGCEVRLCDPCARVRPCVPCVSRLPPVSFYRYVPVP